MNRIIHSIGVFLYSLFITLVLLLLIFAFMTAWNWAIDIAPTFILLIIRVIVVLILMIPGIFAAPFYFWEDMLYFSQYCVYASAFFAIVSLFFSGEERKASF